MRWLVWAGVGLVMGFGFGKASAQEAGQETKPFSGSNVIRLRSGELLGIEGSARPLPQGIDTSTQMIGRVSDDGGKTWSRPIEVFAADDPDYYWMMNDRVLESSSGRIILPTAMQHSGSVEGTRSFAGCFYSDDKGRAWRRSNWITTDVEEDTRGFQEPAIVELADKTLKMYVRTGAGVLYESASADGGATWGKAVATNLISPCAPCNAKRDPYTGFHVLVWNRARPVEPNSLFPRYLLSLAVSTDQTRTWKHVLDIETGPTEGAATDPRAIEYIYASIAFTEEAVVVSYGVYKTQGDKKVSRTETATIPREKAGLK